MSQAAQLADQMPRPISTGYEAERHQSLPDMIVVWAPCGCYYVAHVEGSFVTECRTASCDFKWPEVERALEALRRAEETLQKGDQPSGISAVNSGTSASSLLPEVGGRPSTDVGLAPETKVDECGAQDMISEGGPVDLPTDTPIP